MDPARLRLPGSPPHRIAVDLSTGVVEAQLDHPDAPNDVWAFGIVRRQIDLGDHAWAYLDGFQRLRVLRVRLSSRGAWRARLDQIGDHDAADRETIDAVAATVAALHRPVEPLVTRGSIDGSVSGKVALVTGASRGIGAALAQRLAAAGARVAVSARTLDRPAHERTRHIDTTLGEVVEIIRRRGGTAEPVLADLTDPESPARLVAEVEDRLGPIDLLVNNAARAVYHPLGDWTRERMARLIQANALAPAELARLTLPGMCERGFGSVVNVSSIVAAPPIGPPYGLFERASYTTVYAMAKALMDRMSTGWAVETWRHGVRINSLSPSGGVRTPGAIAMTPMLDRHPENGEATEVMAEAVLALCEPLEPIITGRVLTSGALLCDLDRPVRGLDGGPFVDPYADIDLRPQIDLAAIDDPALAAAPRRAWTRPRPGTV